MGYRGRPRDRPVRRWHGHRHGGDRAALRQAGVRESLVRRPRRPAGAAGTPVSGDAGAPGPLIVAPSPAAIGAAAEAIRRGELVAFPTETVYGLGVDAGNDRAVAAVFAAKGRPRFNPLIVHACGRTAADAVARFDERARALADALWPGPLTLVLPRRAGAGVSLLATAGLDTVAVRVPDHPVALALLQACGRPIAAPSANRSGGVSPTTAAHVAADLGDRVAMVLDGGPCRIGVESTVVDITGPAPVLLRPGGTAVERLHALIGPLEAASGGPPRSPGLLRRHYAPARPVHPDAEAAGAGAAFLAFGPGWPDADRNLSASGSLEEAAANLFAMLRALDREPFRAIAVAPIPRHGLGLAINDRLSRASAPPAPPPGEDDWDDERGPSVPCVLPGDEV
ncbi:MAG: threonylcarbamoyl-AMP synthase [Rhodospirillales bacterium]|nr:MAG: threonylcarbamoyl-AMP synthase [Rhodospirillales bacterium]